VKNKMLIKMRPKPKRPVRATKKYRWFLEEGESLGGIARYFIQLGFSPEDVRFGGNYSEYDYNEYYFYIEGPESEEEFGARLLEYEQKMQKYHNWYEENRALIEQELERRRLVAEEKKIKDEEKAKKRLIKAKEKAIKELAKIEKQLNT
jgi:hypothetical protein